MCDLIIYGKLRNIKLETTDSADIIKTLDIKQVKAWFPLEK